jgi:S1-C subfamily serine protease
VDVPPTSCIPSHGDSDQLKIGQDRGRHWQPLACPAQYGGIVSAKGRTLDSIRKSPGAIFLRGDLIQTDAPSTGHSGGAVNLNGELVGLNRAIRPGDHLHGDRQQWLVCVSVNS